MAKAKNNSKPKTAKAGKGTKASEIASQENEPSARPARIGKRKAVEEILER